MYEITVTTQLFTFCENIINDNAESVDYLAEVNTLP